VSSETLYDGRNKTFFFLGTEAYRQQRWLHQLPRSAHRARARRQLLAEPDQERISDPGAGRYRRSTTRSAQASDRDANGNSRQHRPAEPAEFRSVWYSLANFYPNPNVPTQVLPADQLRLHRELPEPRRPVHVQGRPPVRILGDRRRRLTFTRRRSRPNAPPNIFPNAATPTQNLCCDRKIDATQANATLTPSPTTVVTRPLGIQPLLFEEHAGERRL
jgi:hypothetical protein